MTLNGGTLILSGSDGYSGGTIVKAGKLVVASGNALPDGTGLTVGAGGTLIFDPSQAVAGPIESHSSLAVAVPEPGTVGLLLAALGSAAIHCRVRRRSKGI